MRQKVNNLIDGAIKKMRTRFKNYFTHRVYCYVIAKGKVIESGFLDGTFIDRKNRAWITLKVKNDSANDYQQKHFYLKVPSTRITHYRILYSKAQLFWRNLFGLNIDNTKRKLKPWIK
jgi:hypothetical protein